jgi:hypothetical protein
MITTSKTPASLPKNSANAGAKSLVEIPRKHSTGSTSVTLGDRRDHGSRIALVKRRPSPIVNTWCPDLQFAGRRSHRPRFGHAHVELERIRFRLFRSVYSQHAPYLSLERLHPNSSRPISN